MSIARAQEHLRTKAAKLSAEFNLSDNRMHLLELEFHTPLMISRYKTDVPVPGLPNLDGILQYAAFYWCARGCAIEHPDMTPDYLLQVNQALEGRGWIDFPVPIRSITISHPGTREQQRLCDCSVGLPVDPSTGETCYPVSGGLLCQNGQKLKRVVDNLPLRRRVSHPQRDYKPIALTRRLDTARGATKALDNRMYTLVVDTYRFLFRGDAHWVHCLLDRLREDGVGVGKKTSLGYGRIKDVRIKLSQAGATLGHPLNDAQKQALKTSPNTNIITLLKNIPSDVLFGWCADGQDYTRLLGSSTVKILSIIPVLAGYAPPYWLKSRQALIAQYGSLLYG